MHKPFFNFIVVKGDRNHRILLINWTKIPEVVQKEVMWKYVSRFIMFSHLKSELMITLTNVSSYFLVLFNAPGKKLSY